ncbi:uncharacterized protein LOC126264675 [Aethina tumida]|uniref:uncharacterized protein LOC126264675 n=1 Tax=Aethina tumida TaxID=116153 RepID=UPI00214829C8|nr:uncharacterized protein LOC126264675 [Aethina tumida]
MDVDDHYLMTKLKFEEYKNTVKEQSENFIINELPTFIIELEELLTNPQFQTPKDNSVPTPGDLVTKNSQLTQIMDVIKPFLLQLTEGCNLLVTWMSFQSVKITCQSTADNVIESDVMTGAQQIVTTRFKLFNRCLNYFGDRGKIVEDMFSYPNIAAYQRAIDEIDRKVHLALFKHLTNIKKLCCTLYDTSRNHLEKIKNPKPEGATDFST